MPGLLLPPNRISLLFPWLARHLCHRQVNNSHILLSQSQITSFPYSLLEHHFLNRSAKRPDLLTMSQQYGLVVPLDSVASRNASRNP